jgi:hypothetical protein
MVQDSVTKTLFVVFLFSIGATAVQKSQNSGVMSSDSNSSQTETAARDLTMQGCVTGQQRYTFMQAGTGAMFQLMGTDSQFASARGKLVEITARELPPNPSAPSGELPQLQVRNLRIVGERCPVQPRGARTSERTQPQSPPPASPATPRYPPMGAPDQTPPSVGNNPNVPGASGTPSPGTGNPPPQQPQPSPPQPHR